MVYFEEKLVGLAAIDAVTGRAKKYPSSVTTGNGGLSALGTIGTAVGVGCFDSQFSAFPFKVVEFDNNFTSTIKTRDLFQ